MCAYAPARGVRTRLNTNGHASLIHGRNVVPELVGLVDAVSVSLNASTAQEYDELCHSVYGADAFGAVIEFCKQCKAHGIHTVCSVVDVIGADRIAEAKALCAEIGVECKVRAFIESPEKEQSTRLL